MQHLHDESAQAVPSRADRMSYSADVNWEAMLSDMNHLARMPQRGDRSVAVGGSRALSGSAVLACLSILVTVGVVVSLMVVG
ncbi:hypothetical protein [Micromonospora coxensis]|uniref:Uncharacterized protein n=1 Tax=Micromonospora coxensis TaxID=356852 RepID=A0A1C5HDI0_9ACTN|nr:hypothetical protein [Micromonospora coxensis]SCG44066.1 hypothetical protein GA0070614_1165 [Micromonospora coxensis]